MHSFDDQGRHVEVINAIRSSFADALLNHLNDKEVVNAVKLNQQVVGSIATVSSSLYVGKAGPMVHTSACIASILGQGGSRKYKLTCTWLRYFKNDRDRRDLVTCGAGAGMAAAFRAPVGGVLFALECVSSWYLATAYLSYAAFFTLVHCLFKQSSH